jgi:hypothetical protein
MILLGLIRLRGLPWSGSAEDSLRDRSLVLEARAGIEPACEDLQSST